MAKHELGDAAIKEEYVSQMNAVAKNLDAVFNGSLKGPARRVGFVLLVFPYGAEDGRCNYISNGADRKDIAKMFHEQAARFESEPGSRQKEARADRISKPKRRNNDERRIEDRSN